MVPVRRHGPSGGSSREASDGPSRSDSRKAARRERLGTTCASGTSARISYPSPYSAGSAGSRSAARVTSMSGGRAPTARAASVPRRAARAPGRRCARPGQAAGGLQPQPLVGPGDESRRHARQPRRSASGPTDHCSSWQRQYQAGTVRDADTGVMSTRSVSGHSRRGSGLGDALRRWRDRVPPAAVGLPAGRGRRTPGLRREEPALLAGISAEYVIRLEQGRAGPRPPRCSAPWHGHCACRRPNAPTCSRWPGSPNPRTAGCGDGSRPGCSGRSTGCRARPSACTTRPGRSSPGTGSTPP